MRKGKAIACAAAAASLALLASACGGGSTPASRLTGYLGKVGSEQTAYRRAQRDAISAVDLVDKAAPTQQDCRRASRMIAASSGEYGRLAERMSGIEAPGGLEAQHGKLVRSLRLYARFFDQLRQVIRFCDAGQLLAASTSTLPDRAQALRSQWRVAVLAAAARTGILVPHWTREVGQSP